MANIEQRQQRKQVQKLWRGFRIDFRMSSVFKEAFRDLIIIFLFHKEAWNKKKPSPHVTESTDLV
jgi:hypothetical protein